MRYYRLKPPGLTSLTNHQQDALGTLGYAMFVVTAVWVSATDVAQAKQMVNDLAVKRGLKTFQGDLEVTYEGKTGHKVPTISQWESSAVAWTELEKFGVTPNDQRSYRLPVNIE